MADAFKFMNNYNAKPVFIMWLSRAENLLTGTFVLNGL